MSELCLFVQNNGSLCQCKATKTVPGHTKKYCGRHYEKAAGGPVQQTAGASASTGPVNETISSLINMKLTKENKTKRNKAAETIYQCIIETIVDVNSDILSVEDRDIISKSLPKCDHQVFNLIIQNSVKDSGATTEKFDYLEIARKIPEKYAGYSRAISLQSGNVTTCISFDVKRDNCRVVKVPVKLFISNDEMNQKKACFYYPKADLRIMNFKHMNRYLLFNDNTSFEGYEEIKEFKKYEPLNMSSDQQSWMFIPRDYKFLTRNEQNQHDTQRILDLIKSEKEDPKKYLALKGRTLCCDCLPECCHCEVFVNVIENLMP